MAQNTHTHGAHDAEGADLSRLQEGFAGEDRGRKEDEERGQEAWVVDDLSSGEGGEEGAGVVYGVDEDWDGLGGGLRGRGFHGAGWGVGEWGWMGEEGYVLNP